MKAAGHFKFCPRCGRPGLGRPKPECVHCDGCGFHYYFNAAVSASAILLGPDGRILLIRRAKPPGQGKLALPGGFVDMDETAEAALRLEIREEVNLRISALEFLCSQTNAYDCRGITYPVCDLFFIAQAVNPSRAIARDGVDSVHWWDLQQYRQTCQSQAVGRQEHHSLAQIT